MPTEAKATTAYENPLIPNQRLRQIYSAILHARLLGESLPSAQRRATYGLEACLVSTAVDLAARDLVSDTLSGPVIDLLRSISFAASPQAPDAEPLNPTRKQRTAQAAFATPSRLPAAATPTERFWSALGAAASLRAAAAKSTAWAKANNGARRQPSVLVCYAQHAELSSSLWNSVLLFAGQHELPVIFVVLPPTAKSISAPPRPLRLSNIAALALRNHVPSIAVDANDPIAIYRVAQESIGRTRAGGGPALIECVPFAIQGARTLPEDALPALRRYLLERGVATRARIDRLDREAHTAARRLASKPK
jgi:Dehydrogenase E1 component